VASEADEASPRQGIQSVEIAMTVLEALEAGLGPMSLTKIAAACGMQPSKTHRYLVSLVRAGLIAQSPDSGLYDMGPALRRLGAEALRRMDEVGLVSQHLPGLRDRTGHAVNLAVWGDYGPVVVRWDYGSYALPITVRVGATMSMLASSIGRVYLTYLPATLTEPVLRAQSQDGGGQAGPDEIESIKATTRRTGWALTSGGELEQAHAGIPKPLLKTVAGERAGRCRGCQQAEPAAHDVVEQPLTAVERDGAVHGQLPGP
jgi:DNA-binding IclR family transcriptional regulator